MEAWLVIWLALLGVSLGAAWRFGGKLPWWLAPALGLVLLASDFQQPPAFRLLAASLLFLYLMKAAALAKIGSRPARLGAVAYLTVWPGIDPTPLSKGGEPSEDTGRAFQRGLASVGIGSALLLPLMLVGPQVPRAVAEWSGIAAILLIVHLGIGGMLYAVLHLANLPVRPLFDRPLASRSLRDFWTKRWNRPFVEMDRVLFIEPLRRRFGIHGAMFGVFLISGLLHEMAISYPSGAGWGGPLLYFAIQGAAVLLEAKWRKTSRLATWLVILLPLPILFHTAFRETFILALIDAGHAFLTQHGLDWWMNLLVWVLGLAHFCVLIASFQVPLRLGWREELPRLSSFNRKLVWTLGGFTTMTITAFGTLTLVLHRQLMAGDTAALAIAVYIVCFWSARLLIDAFYYRHSDWPEGQQFVVGHTLLNCLFLFLVAGYGSLLAWHWL